jgi:aminoglycoside 6'-N-acetyltransferase I
MKTRPMKIQEQAVWVDMRNALWPKNPELNSKEANDFVSGNSDNIKEVIFAETEQNEIIGFIELNIRSYASGSTQDAVPYIEGWYVKDAFQGQGIGRLLVDAAEQWAKKSGFFELASDAEDDNERSIAAHKKLGFSEIKRVVCLLKRLN